MFVNNFFKLFFVAFFESLKQQLWYTKRVAAETDNNKEPWKSKIEQYVKPWKFE